MKGKQAKRIMKSVGVNLRNRFCASDILVQTSDNHISSSIIENIQKSKKPYFHYSFSHQTEPGEVVKEEFYIGEMTNRFAELIADQIGEKGCVTLEMSKNIKKSKVYSKDGINIRFTQNKDTVGTRIEFEIIVVPLTSSGNFISIDKGEDFDDEDFDF